MNKNDKLLICPPPPRKACGSRVLAFTLAEVLIPLTILGIVAAIVLPITIRKFEEKIFVTKASKTYALIESIGEQVLIMNGPFEAWDLSNMSSYKGSQTIYNYFKPYLKIHKVCEKNAGNCMGTSYKTFNGYNGYVGDYLSSSVIVTLNNGVSLLFWSKGNYECRTSKEGNCGALFFDVNGAKGPNVQGIDTFAVFMFPNKQVFGKKGSHMGIYNYTAGCSKTSSDSNNGQHCLLWVLNKKNMDYLRRDIEKERKLLKTYF